MALHKTISEIRKLPYPEFRSWQLFYLLEPWGWNNEEYYAACNIAMQYNVNRGKSKAKEPSDFMRDMSGELLKQLEQKQDTNELSRDDIIALIKKDFGI